MHLYTVEMTDTLNGQANYSWVLREQIQAKNPKQAITKFKIARQIGRHRKNYDIGGLVRVVRVDLVGVCICIICRE